MAAWLRLAISAANFYFVYRRPRIPRREVGLGSVRDWGLGGREDGGGENGGDV